MLAGENVSALARELEMMRKDSDAWRDRFQKGGPEALCGLGRPRKAEAAGLAVSGTSAKAAAETPAAELAAARKRIAELERKVGQRLDLDFFQRALRHVGTPRQPGTKPGATGSTKSSKR